MTGPQLVSGLCLRYKDTCACTFKLPGALSEWRIWYSRARTAFRSVPRINVHVAVFFLLRSTAFDCAFLYLHERNRQTGEEGAEQRMDRDA